jgi:hypothetical protein
MRARVNVTAILPRMDRYCQIPATRATTLPPRLLCYGHTLADQIGGQLDAGFLLAGFYEDRDPGHLLATFLPTFIATRALKPGPGRVITAG